MSSAAPVPAPASAPGSGGASPPAAGAAAIAVTGQVLPVAPGQSLAARVLAIQGGLVELSLAGGRVSAETGLALEPGQTLRLVVDDATADRVTLRLAPQAGAGGSPGGAGVAPAAALSAAGLSPAAAAALLAAMAEAGLDPPSGAAAHHALAARAAAAGVATPAQAAAFARLAAAGLPTTPAAVSGLAGLLDGAPLGRALAGLLDAARAASPETAAGPPGGAAGVRADWQSTASPIGTTLAGTGRIPLPTGVLAPTGPGFANWHTARSPIGTGPTAIPAPAPSAAPPTTLPALAAALAGVIASVGEGATAGHPDHLRQALAELGGGLEARLAAGSSPDAAPARALLLALAAHPAADASLARSAAGLADALAAQGLAGAAMPAPAGSADPSSQGGAYLQVPLPGGATAEVRVSPDGGGTDAQGRERPRRLAFLLHLSALGPVMIEASAGPGGVEATVRVTAEETRRFLAGEARDLAEALGRPGAAPARVSVERMTGPAPERLLAPPPSSGLDLQA